MCFRLIFYLRSSFARNYWRSPTAPLSAKPRARALKRSAEFSGALQTPALTFATVVPYLSGENGANAVAIADVNNDGKPDLVVTNWCPYSSCTTPGPNVDVLLGNGDGTFQTDGRLRIGRAVCRLNCCSGRKRGWKALT